MTSSWYKMLKQEMEERGDNFFKRVCTLNEKELKVNFHEGYGRENGKPFTAWGENYVYFPICYDGAEWVGYAPRNPTEHALKNPMRHQGG